MNACANANPERNGNADEADQDKGNTTCFQTYFPQSHQQGVDGKNLVRCSSISLKPEDNRRGNTPR